MIILLFIVKFIIPLAKWDAITLMMEDIGCCILGDHKYAYRWNRIMKNLVVSNQQHQLICDDHLINQVNSLYIKYMYIFIITFRCL